MTAAELIERIKDNPDGEVVVHIPFRACHGESLPVTRVDEPYVGVTVLYLGTETS